MITIILDVASSSAGLVVEKPGDCHSSSLNTDSALGRSSAAAAASTTTAGVTQSSEVSPFYDNN